MAWPLSLQRANKNSGIHRAVLCAFPTFLSFAFFVVKRSGNSIADAASTLNIVDSLAGGFRRQQKQDAERPNTAKESDHGPCRFAAAAVVGDDTAENRIEQMNQCGGAQQGRRIHFRPYEKKSGEVSEELVEIHEPPLTLPSAG